MTPKVPLIVNGKKHWQCSVCLGYFAEDGFHRYTAAKNGLRSDCRRCCSVARSELYYSDAEAARNKNNRQWRLRKVYCGCRGR